MTSRAEVTFGYLNPGVAYLRECQERGSARLLEAVELRCAEGAWAPSPSGHEYHGMSYLPT